MKSSVDTATSIRHLTINQPTVFICHDHKLTSLLFNYWVCVIDLRSLYSGGRWTQEDTISCIRASSKLTDYMRASLTKPKHGWTKHFNRDGLLEIIFLSLIFWFLFMNISLCLCWSTTIISDKSCFYVVNDKSGSFIVEKHFSSCY